MGGIKRLLWNVENDILLYLSVRPHPPYQSAFYLYLETLDLPYRSFESGTGLNVELGTRRRKMMLGTIPNCGL